MSGEITSSRRRAIVVAAAAAVVVAVVVFLLLSGNRSDTATPEPVAPTTLAPTTPSATPSTAEPEPPVLPAEATKPTTKGAAAFVRYFFEVYNYSFASLDSSELRSASKSDCAFCNVIAENVAEIISVGGRSEDGEMSVSVAVAAPGDIEQGLIVSVVLNQSEGRVLDANGDVLSAVTPRRDRRADLLVVWNENGWRVAAVDADPQQ